MFACTIHYFMIHQVATVQITERDKESYVKPLCDNDAIDGIGGENKERDGISGFNSTFNNI